jgi:3-deoxy-D-manno-octulosonate 8-phosphate phosphatase (KDO 8-P phosphatase)
MRVVGLPVAVANAVPEIKAVARVCLTKTGGRGATREFTELLLKARGEWEEIVERYVADRSMPTLEVLR